MAVENRFNPSEYLNEELQKNIRKVKDLEKEIAELKKPGHILVSREQIRKAFEKTRSGKFLGEAYSFCGHVEKELFGDYGK